MHRFTWDMHYQPSSMWRPPDRWTDPPDRGDRPQHRAGADDAVGQSRQFTVKLTVNGKSYTQPIVVKQIRA
jgi:hypothetical protein